MFKGVVIFNFPLFIKGLLFRKKLLLEKSYSKAINKADSYFTIKSGTTAQERGYPRFLSYINYLSLKAVYNFPGLKKATAKINKKDTATYIATIALPLFLSLSSS